MTTGFNSSLWNRTIKQPQIEQTVKNGKMYETQKLDGKIIRTSIFEDLNHDGKLILVIRKNHGEESIKKYMEGIFENVEIIRRDKGFYVLVGYNGNN